MKWAKFIAGLLPSLYELGRLLFIRFHGDLNAAKKELERIPDYWASVPAERAQIDKELDALRDKPPGGGS